MNWEWILGALPLLLLLLACPLAMFWMMRGMSHGESSGKNAKNRHDGLAVVPVHTDQEIRALRERLARLEAQQHQQPENWR